MPPERLGSGRRGVCGRRRAGDASQRCLSGVEFPHSDRHSGLTDTGGTGDCSDPAVAEGLGFRPYQQATLPLVEVRHNRLELGCQHGPLPVQLALSRATNHQAESYELKICTPLVGAHEKAPALPSRGACALACVDP